MMHDDEQQTVADDLRRWLADDADGVVAPRSAPGDHTDDDAEIVPTGAHVRRRARVLGLAATVGLPWVVVTVLVLVDASPPRPGGAMHTRAEAGPSTRADVAGSPARSPVARPDAAELPPATRDAAGQPRATPPDAARPAAPPDAGGQSQDAAGLRPDPAPSGPTPDATPRPSPPEPEPPGGIAPTAVRLVRDAVTRTRGGVTTALDTAAAEQPSPLGADVWLVRVHAVVLRGDRRRWHRATHELWAVPLALRGGRVAALAEPWRAGRARTARAVASWRPARTDLAAVRTALRRAGAAVPAGMRVERHPTIPGIVRAVGDGNGPAVWLRLEPHPHVLGAPASGSSAP